MRSRTLQVKSYYLHIYASCIITYTKSPRDQEIDNTYQYRSLSPRLLHNHEPIFILIFSFNPPPIILNPQSPSSPLPLGYKYPHHNPSPFPFFSINKRKMTSKCMRGTPIKQTQNSERCPLSTHTPPSLRRLQTRYRYLVIHRA